MIKDIFNDKNLIPGFKFTGEQGKLGPVVSSFLDIIFYIVTFLAFFWLVWGAFEYITAGGEKEKLNSARNRISWAIVGLLITFAAFFIAQFAAQILGLEGKTPII